MMIFLIIYTSIGLLIGINSSIHIVPNHDRFDWRHRKGHIIQMMTLSFFLWPVHFARISNFIHPENYLAEDEMSIGNIIRKYEKRERKRDLYRICPPPCSSIVRYYTSDPDTGEDACQFTFKAKDVEYHLLGMMDDHPHLEKNHEGSILKWLNMRNETDMEPTDVPPEWDRFIYAADSLIHDGKVEIHCLKCCSDIHPKDLKFVYDYKMAGWNYDRTFCPCGNLLLQRKTAHIMM